MRCPCDNDKEYAACCERVHNDLNEAKSAEILMRARYSAFVKQNIDFIYNTFHHTTRGFQNKKDIEQWAKESTWLGLEIIKSSTNSVQFKAHYLDPKLGKQVHYENSSFKEVEDIWYYVDGSLLT